MTEEEKDALESAVCAHLKAMNYICKTYGYSAVTVTAFSKIKDGQQENFNIQGGKNINETCIANAQMSLDSLKDLANG